MTLVEFKEYLARTYDELTLIDKLGLNSFELVEYLSDVIDSKFDQLYQEEFPEGEEGGQDV